MNPPLPGTTDLDVVPPDLPTTQSASFNVHTTPASADNTAPTLDQPQPASRDAPMSQSPSTFATPALRDQPIANQSRTAGRSLNPNNNVAQRQKRSASRLPPKAPLSKRNKTQAGRGNGFSQGETDNLLELLQEHLPLGKDEWERITRLHETRYPSQKRTADSLRRKFSALCRTSVPTGDPSIPPEVLKAKAIREEMAERADIGDGAESGDEYTEDINDETALLQTSLLEETASEGAYVIEDGNNRASVGASPNATHSVTPSPRPLVRKRGLSGAKQATDDDIIVGALRVSMLQEQMRREEEHHQRMMDREDERIRREEERRLREEQRTEERERREDDRRRNENMMNLMMLALLGKRGEDVAKNSLGERDE